MAHEFRVDVDWTEGFRGEIRADGVDAAIPFGVPQQFGGEGDRWTPEHCFAAAVSGCIVATFLSMAKQSKLEFTRLSSDATAALEKTPEGLRMTQVTVRLRLAVGSESEVERARRLVLKAESYCPISNSVTAKVELEPIVEATG